MRRGSFLLPLLFVASLFVAVRTIGADAPIAPPRLGSSPRYPLTWQLATNGEEYLLAWNTQTRTQFATLNERGEVIAEAGFDSAAGIGDVIAVQRDYLVVLGTSLLTVDAGTLAVTRTHETPYDGVSVLATDGATALMANAGGSARIVDADGDSVVPDFQFAEGAAAAIGAAGAHGSHLLVWLGSSLGWNGSEALALWQGNGGVHAARIGRDGSVLASHLLGPNTDITPPSLSVAWTGYGWVAANGPQLLHLRADGSFQSRADLGASVTASTATPTLVAYQRTAGDTTQVFTRKLARPRRRAVDR